MDYVGFLFNCFIFTTRPFMGKISLRCDGHLSEGFKRYKMSEN